MCPSPVWLDALGEGGLREAASLEQLFPTTLVLGDKPYPLISPSHRQTESALANDTLELHWLPALLVREGAMAGDPRRHTYYESPRDTSSTDRHR